MEQITYITGNAGKAKYVSEYSGVPFAHKALDIQEIQSLDLEEVVKDKAMRAYEIVKGPVLVEDTSLVFEALGKKLPGPLIKWFLDALGNEGLTKLLDGYGHRDATAICTYALYDGKEMHLFTGEWEGRVPEVPQGEAGFGWDSIFIPKGRSETYAEMMPDEKHEFSMRRLALEKLKAYLETRGE